MSDPKFSTFAEAWDIYMTPLRNAKLSTDSISVMENAFLQGAAAAVFLTAKALATEDNGEAIDELRVELITRVELNREQTQQRFRDLNTTNPDRPLH